MLFSREHSYLFLPGVKRQQQLGTTLTSGLPPGSHHSNADFDICLQDGLHWSHCSSVCGPGNTGASLLCEKLYFTSNLLVHSEGVPRRVREPHCRTRMLIYIFFFKITLAAPWRMDYRGQSGCWENGEG